MGGINGGGEERALGTRGKFVTGHHNTRTLACSPITCDSVKILA